MKIAGRHVTGSQITGQVLLLVLVLLWTLPTLGLLISSLRDKDQLITSGWWSALSTTEITERGRTGNADDQVEVDGQFEISGNLLEDREGAEIAFWSDNINDIQANTPGQSFDMEDGGTITVNADGSYRWIADQPFTLSRGERIFYEAHVPPIFTLDNYQEVLEAEGIGRAFINTLTVTIPATAIPILIAAFCAYAFSWMRFPGRNWLFAVVVGLLVVPLQMSLIPLLRLYNEVGSTFGVEAKSYVGIWLAHTGFGLPLAIYLLRNYIGTLPRDLIESAKVDGATHYHIFTRLVMPLSVPALASFAIFQFLWVWNDLLVALVFLSKNDNQIVMTSQLRELLGSRGDNWEILTSGAFVSMIVPLLVFFALQRYFVRGLTAGSVKG